MKLLLAAALSVTLLGACAGTPDPEEVAATGASASGEPQVCRRFAVTGSRNAVRRCHTAAEWAAIADREQALSLNTPRGNSGVPSATGGGANSNGGAGVVGGNTQTTPR
jgi:hypothetical protein